MPVKRNLCAQCRAYDTGYIDKRDGKWYCHSCWREYEGNTNIAKHNRGRTINASGKQHTNNVSITNNNTSSKNDNTSGNNLADNKNNYENNKHFNQANPPYEESSQTSSINVQHQSSNNQNERHHCTTQANVRSNENKLFNSCQAGTNAKDTNVNIISERNDNNDNKSTNTPLNRLSWLVNRCQHLSKNYTGSNFSTRRESTCAKDNTHSMEVRLWQDGVAKTLMRGTFVSVNCEPQRPVAVVAHTGDPLSPRGDAVGGAGRSSYQERHKVTLDTLLSSADDVVSQIYVCFDEDMTKLLLNCLDRVTACETADQRDRVKIKVIDELLDVVGEKHYDLLQCIMYRPREIFIRLLEEFCTLNDDDDDDDNNGAAEYNNSREQNNLYGIGGGNNGMNAMNRNAAHDTSGNGRNVMTGGSKIALCGYSYQFMRGGRPRNGSSGNSVVFAKNGELTDERWLSHMNERYRALLQETELDAMFKKDFSVMGSSMPSGITITRKPGHVRVHIPSPLPNVLPEDKRVCVATELPEWTHAAFKPITHLNTVQTTIFHTAFHTTQNMLICAPTGAGKTVCALLVMLRCISDHMNNGQLDRNFKMIFVAPMKALAQEMVNNFARRLSPFLIKVRELTGDMQLTKREIAETHVIVTTPEKWDVITRKQSNDLTDAVRLIVMDEIHLLNEDRGPVLEAIVARTLRQGEVDSSHQVRLVGLSATLPNYKDVANFLQVDLKEGLKVFGPEYRPVPLEQTFIGLQDISKSKEQQLDDLAYAEVLENVRRGHQVMVFVHSRKQTVALCKHFIERSKQRGQESIFKNDEATLPTQVVRRGQSLNGRDLSMLFSAGFGAHHAGLVRYDRTTTEDLFRDGYIKVLCCTSTLAWGVNLPAHTVVIRGTQLYDPKRGGLVSISVLDVMQIFGRAGRPQFDTSGHGIIISDEKEVAHFLRLLAHALPIESQMQRRLCDHLNAEVTAGTISSITEASSWLEYTYMWQRIRVNPLLYGLKVNDVRKDPELYGVRQGMIDTAFSELAVAGMVRYNPEMGTVDSTDLGRLASHYYLTHETINIFNEKMKRNDGTWVESLDMGAALNIAACANEFAQLRLRPEELPELEKLNLNLPHVVREFRLTGESADDTSVQWKVTTLLKAYVSRMPTEEHSLTADTNYVVQNMPRIARALFEIELERGHPLTTYTFLTLCKCIEHRCWEFEHPLLQFTSWSHRVNITDAVWMNLMRYNPSMSMLQEMSAREVGELVHNTRAGYEIASFVRHFPSLSLAVDVQPITRSILRVKVTITPCFQWNREISGNAELFWLLVEDQNNNFIFHHESISLTRKEVESNTPHVVHLAVPVVPQYDMYSVRLYSDRWLGCSEDYTFSIGHLHLPEDAQITTKLLPLNPLRLSVIPEKYHVLYNTKYTQFNAVQTQTFHTMYHTDENVFLGAPTGSGKTIAAEMAVLRVFEQYPHAKIVYIAPLKALVKERLRDWRGRMTRIGRTVVELSGDATPDLNALARADILCTTPEKWDGVSRSWQVRRYVTTVRLVIFDEIHMLGTDRGPILEVIVSRMRYIGWNLNAPVRLIGLSTAVSNPADLSSWLGVSKRWAVYNFDPSVRPVPMTVHIAGYHGKHYCPRMMAMNKPTYNAICERSPTQPVIVFVSSRRQTRNTALAIIGFLLMDGHTGRWVHMDVAEMERYTSKLDDDIVKHCFQFGVGLHHAGLLESDRAVVEEAFLACKIQILVATSTLAWGVNFPAHMVVVKGTEYYDAKTHGYVDFPITDLLQMVGRAGRPQFDTEGVAQVLCMESKKGFYRKFLYDPFPVESSLHKCLHVHLNAEIVSGTIKTRQDAVNYLTWTYLFRRVARNPSFYGLEDGNAAAITSFMSNLVKDTLTDLESCGCIEPIDPNDPNVDSDALQYTVLGKLCSYYYISHITVNMFNTQLTFNLSQVEVLRILCNAEEFNELPVRHNEDRKNIEIARTLPLPIKEAEAESPHVKAFVLLQAQFARIVMPVDYVTDLKSTMDNAVRVIQAMVDVAANSGHLHTTLKCMTLMQCIVQGRWWSDSTLLQLPHLTANMLPVIYDLCQVRHIAQLANMKREQHDAFRRVLERRELHLFKEQIAEIMHTVQSLPLIRVSLTYTTVSNFNNDNDDDDKEMKETYYDIHVHLKRSSPYHKHVVAPRFSKAKDEQYWIVIGNENTGELVALKRLNRLQQTSTVTLRVEWDNEWNRQSNNNNNIIEVAMIKEANTTDTETNWANQATKLTHSAATNNISRTAIDSNTTKNTLTTKQGVSLNVYVICDAYLGMDQQYSFVLPHPKEVKEEDKESIPKIKF